MDTLLWSSSYSVGVKILDDQHKNILKMINLLGSQSSTAVDSEIVSDLLNDLTRYAAEHFKTEEGLLQQYDYPDMDSHKNVHREYRLKVVGFCQDAMLHKQTVPDELLQFLGEWWIAHILDSDMEYKEFLRERGVR